MRSCRGAIHCARNGWRSPGFRSIILTLLSCVQHVGAGYKPARKEGPLSTPVRRTIRLPGFDYTRPRAYFVTICAHDRACLFGDVVDGAARLNEFGEIVREEWGRSAEIRAELTIDAYVIMPNHFHGIVMIDVGAHGARPSNMGDRVNRAHGRAPLRPPKSLGSFIAGFKSISTKRINLLRHLPAQQVWQRNCFEHVIRNDADLAAIRDYIAGNPARWADDENHSECVSTL